MNKLFLSSLIVFSALASAAHADDYTITLKDHTFTPSEITVPAGKQVKLIVKNEDSSVAEFESHELNREKVVKGNDSITLLIGPLEAGSYGFVDEFHEATAKGTIIAK